ncbi:hypothetical protein N8I77_008782 [Diaporthe amygdali]|uniref:Choline transport protein n=1 Tax=Phomopsis amygdali TaxID=1214568 RepID=A0AAD9S9S3_PHOAM|nr:hypothetical protein N8I77_008782 [Diaporthe amygdali]
MEALAPIQSEAELGSVEELRGRPVRPFNTISTLAVSMTLMATWEAICSTMGSGLISGGPVSLVYGFILAFIGSICTALTLAELASMYPHAGGQYHVLSEIVANRFKPVLAWYCTYLTSLGWLALSASAPFLASQMTQGLLVLNYPDFKPHAWLSSCIYWGILLVGYIANVWGYRMLPLLEKLVMILHILFFLVVFVIALVLPPERKSATFVFTTFVNETRWRSDGVAWFLGLLTSSYVMVGYDAAMHLSEEMADPRIEVPRAMVGAIGFNGILGLAVLLAVLFGIGDIEAALGTPTGYPIIEVFHWMTRGNEAAATALTCTIVLSAAFATLGLVATSSRTIWSAARDGVLPGSKYLARLSARHNDIPFLAITFTTALMALLELLNVASTTAFTAILSLAVVALYISYLMPVSVMLYLRLQLRNDIKWGPWKLPPSVGLTANIISVCYTTVVSGFLLLPPAQPVTAVNMNYAGVVLGGVLIFSTIGWIGYGRKHYEGPILI